MFGKIKTSLSNFVHNKRAMSDVQKSAVIMFGLVVGVSYFTYDYLVGIMGTLAVLVPGVIALAAWWATGKVKKAVDK